jgi:hypothetical protein
VTGLVVIDGCAKSCAARNTAATGSNAVRCVDLDDQARSTSEVTSWLSDDARLLSGGFESSA